MSTRADTLILAEQITSGNAKAYLHALVRSYDLASAAYVAHTIPGRPPNAPIIWATHVDDWLFDYVAEHHARIDSVVAIENTSVLPIDLEIVLRSTDHVRRSTSLVINATGAVGGRKQVLMVPVRGPLGDRAFLVVSTHEYDADWRAKRRALVPNLLLVAQYVHHHAMVEAGVYNAHDGDIRLAPREAECLHWAAAGKTVEDIATILNISCRVTRAYLDGARHKLNASNIAHAVARAVSLGLVASG